MRLIGLAPEDALVATTVSKHVNSVKNDDPECVVPPVSEARPTWWVSLSLGLASSTTRARNRWFR